MPQIVGSRCDARWDVNRVTACRPTRRLRMVETAAFRQLSSSRLHCHCRRDNPDLAGVFHSECRKRRLDQLTEMRVFVRAIERGAFAAAAKELGLTASAVSKLKTRLEGRLGVRLVNRTTRQLSLTPEGELYFESGRRLIEEVEGLEDEVGAAAGRPRGLIRVNASYGFGFQKLTPALAEFNRLYPDVRINLSLSDRMVDLHAESIDVAIRSTGAQNDSNLVARKIAETQRVICASPSYIEMFGAPLAPDELSRHRVIIFSLPHRGHRWPFRMPDGAVSDVEVSGPIITDNTECAIQFALSGIGMIRVNRMFVEDHIAAGRLIPVLDAYDIVERLMTWAVFPAGAQHLPRVRAFVDFLVERFAGS
jgi:DNA-binding transcriptional LysR family regulator